MSCSYSGGHNLRAWLVEVTAGNCGNAPLSSGTTYSPSFSGLDTTSGDYVGAVESFNLTYGHEIQNVNSAELLGATGTVRGVAAGNGEMVLIADPENPLGDVVQSGALYDFVVTIGKLTSGVVIPVNPTTADSEKIVGRLRVGQCQATMNENGEPVRLTMPFSTHSLCYGLLIGSPDAT